MIALPLLDAHDPMLRVESLHALAYCPRLFYLEEVEEIRVADAAVFAGRQLHAALEADEDGEAVNIELASSTLGLTGKVDCLRRRDGSYLPYEHKRGQPRRPNGQQPDAWPSDRLQIIAYAVLLEEAFGQPIPEGRIRYHAANVTVRVPIDDAARADLQAAVAEARRLRQTVERPPIADNERLCARCSLAPVCLPEEVRQEREPEHDPVRLFPPDRDGTTLHVVSQGAQVGCSGDSLVVRPRDQPETKHPIRGVDTVLLHGFSQLTTQALRRCVEHGVGVHWLTTSGLPHRQPCSDGGSGTAPHPPVSRPDGRGDLPASGEGAGSRQDRRSASLSAAGHARRQRYAAGSAAEPDRHPGRLARVHTAPDRDSLRGQEGQAAVHYFQGLRAVLGDQVPEELRSTTRNRRPPLDRFNALLSYGYGLLHTAVMRAVLAVGLEPALGFFHTPRSAAYPLILDLLELFRVTLWDMTLIGSLNRGQWDVNADFAVTRAKVWLSETGRKKAIGLFEARLEESWKHPVLNYSLSYARTIELEARLLEKEWTGEPNLFARSRLR